MKQIIIIISYVMVCSITSIAQTSEPSAYQNKQATKYTNELIKYISDIVPEQEKAIYNLNMTIVLQFDSVKKLELETIEYKKAAREIFVNKDKQLKKLLNINQYDEYEMMKAEKKEEYVKKKKQQAKIVSIDSTFKKTIITDSLLKK